MDILSGAVTTLFLPYNLLLLLAGLIGGIIVGALPGLSATMAVALMIPFTFVMDATSGLVMLGAIYIGGIYGGSIPAGLVCTPGTASSVATTFDCWPLSQKGRAEEGLFASLLSSATGGLIGTVFLMTLAAPLARFALKFGAPETFWLCIFGLSSIALMSSGAALKGLLSGLIGLLISTIGIDPNTGFARFTFGSYALIQGVGIVPSMIGLFSLAQVMILAGSNSQYVAEYHPSPGLLQKTARKIFGFCKVNLLRSSIIGTIVGMMPGAGGEIASIISYNEAKRWDKHPEKYGTGAIEGVVASEAANNAVIGGSLIPLLTLGIPGSAVAAVLLGALLAKGITPGFQVFTENAGLVYTFVMSQFLGNLLLIPVGFLMIKCLVRLLRLRTTFLCVAIIVLSIIGVYSVRNDMLDVWLVLLFGGFGYFVHRVGLDAGSLALGIILGPMVDENLSMIMQLSESSGSVSSVFFQSPVCIFLIICTTISILSPYIKNIRKIRHHEKLPPLNANQTTKTAIMSIVAAILIMVSFVVQMPEGSIKDNIYPILLCVGITVVCAALSLETWMNRYREVKKATQKFFMSRVYISIIGSLVYGICIYYLGFIIATVLFLLIMPFTLKDKGGVPMYNYVLMSIAFSSIFAIFLWIVFVFALHVPFPSGIIFS